MMGAQPILNTYYSDMYRYLTGIHGGCGGEDGGGVYFNGYDRYFHIFFGPVGMGYSLGSIPLVSSGSTTGDLPS